MARALAIFDFDGTLLPGDSIVAFVGFARKRGDLPRGEYLRVLAATARYLLGGMTDGEIKTRSLRFLNRLSPAERETLAADFVKDRLLPRVYGDARAALARHRERGDVTLLVSASTDNYMRIAADALGFDALLCTELTADHAVKENCKGAEKARRVRAWLRESGVEADWAASYAYGDSKSDESVLRLCGHPVLVNPKRALRRAMPEAETAVWR